MNEDLQHELPLKIVAAIESVINEDGMEVEYSRVVGLQEYVIKFRSLVEAPPLGVHVRDGVGSSDKVGG